MAELKRAKLEKAKYIEKMMLENFAGIDEYNADKKLAAIEFCEGSHRHFLTTFETWINDNYPADVTPGQLFDADGFDAWVNRIRKTFGENYRP